MGNSRKLSENLHGNILAIDTEFYFIIIIMASMLIQLRTGRHTNSTILLATLNREQQEMVSIYMDGPAIP